MNPAQRLNAELKVQRHGWLASLHRADGHVLEVAGATSELAFPAWYRERAELTVVRFGGVVVIWRAGAPVETIACRGLSEEVPA